MKRLRSMQIAQRQAETWPRPIRYLDGSSIAIASSFVTRAAAILNQNSRITEAYAIRVCDGGNAVVAERRPERRMRWRPGHFVETWEAKIDGLRLVEALAALAEQLVIDIATDVRIDRWRIMTFSSKNGRVEKDIYDDADPLIDHSVPLFGGPSERVNQAIKAGIISCRSKPYGSRR